MDNSLYIIIDFLKLVCSDNPPDSMFWFILLRGGLSCDMIKK